MLTFQKSSVIPEKIAICFFQKKLLEVSEYLLNIDKPLDKLMLIVPFDYIITV